MQAIANLNGTIQAAKDTKISIFDRGFLYGDSIYEVVRTYDGVAFYHQEHLDRLENSARLARMPLSQSRELLDQEIRRTVKAANPKTDVFVRYTLTRGEGPLDLDPATAQQTSYLILVKELPQWNQRFYQSGVNLFIPEIRRNSPMSLDPNIKSGNYLNNVIAVGEAKKHGADDALLLSAEGKLTEASNSNICFVQDKKIISPLHEPQTHTGNLKGITKLVVKELCQRLGLQYEEKALYPEHIKEFSEAFVSSATREVMPVKKITDGKSSQDFPSAGGSVTRALQKEYKQFLKEYIDQHRAESFFTL